MFSILGSVGAIVTAAIFTLLSKRAQKLSINILIAYATGTLLSASLLGLIPEAIESSGGETHSIMFVVLGGILFFFFLEKIIIWRNCQNEDCEVHGVAGPIVLVGDAFHNFVDGLVIAAAFLTNFYVGIAAGLSILMHEIPQETGDFGILLHGGFSKKKAFIYNLISSSTTIPAAIMGYFILDLVSEMIPFLLAFSAASFIYIALSDLSPELHTQTNIKYGIRQLLLVIAGVLTMVFIIILNTHQH